MALVRVQQGDALSTRALALVHSCLTEDPRLAISVWQARSDTSARETARMKCYNQAFLDLCDTTAFGGGKLEDVTPANPVFLSDEVAALARASVTRCNEVLDLIHQGTLQYGRGQRLFISRLGRAKIITLAIHAVTDQPRLEEFVVTALVMPYDLNALSADLQQGYGFDFPIRERRSPPEGEWMLVPAAAVEQSQLPEVSGKPLRWKVMQSKPRPQVERPKKELKALLKPKPAARSATGPWECASCRCTSTTQQRRGPFGPLTLCNPCGLRWRKKQRDRLDELDELS